MVLKPPQFLYKTVVANLNKMNIRLEKRNRKTTDYVEIETNGHNLFVRIGKIKKPGITESTKHCGTEENAENEGEVIKEEYLNKKFEVVETKRPEKFDGVYDKAKWHFCGDFPKELDQFQGYVHTGFYITWLIANDFFETNNDEFLTTEVQKVKQRERTGAEFFQKCLDGVLMDDDLTELGNKFTFSYYEKGDFHEDYSESLGNEFPTLYHIQDNWENYEQFKLIIDKKLKEWKKSNRTKWWKLK